MSFITDEVQFPALVITVIIGFQITFSFFSQYIKYKRENIKLNKILLAYSLFFGFAMVGLISRIIKNNFPPILITNELLTQMTDLFFGIGVISFLITISTKEINRVGNLNIPRILIILNIFFITLSFVYDPFKFAIPYYMVFVLLGFIYLIIFQNKLIKIASENIKKRLRLILIGEIFLLIGLLVGGEGSRSFLRFNEEILILITIPINILSLLLIFLGNYNFPAFLELDWTRHLIKFSIIDYKRVKEIYAYDFKNKDIKPNDTKDTQVNLISQALVGLEDLVSEVSEISVKTSIVKKGDTIIFFEYSDNENLPLIYTLFTDNEMASHKYLLKSLEGQFQGWFREILTEYNFIVELESELFTSFDLIIKNLVS